MPRRPRVYGAYLVVAKAIDHGCRTLTTIRERTGYENHQIVHALRTLQDNGWAKPLNPTRGNRFQPSVYVLTVSLEVINLPEPARMDATELWDALGMPKAVPVVGERRKHTMWTAEDMAE